MFCGIVVRAGCCVPRLSSYPVLSEFQSIWRTTRIFTNSWENLERIFFLWSAQTEAALAAKEVLLMIENDVISVNEAPSDELQSKIATARAVLIQGLGYRPLRLWLCVKDNPFKIWKRLKDMYAVTIRQLRCSCRPGLLACLTKTNRCGITWMHLKRSSIA